MKRSDKGPSMQERVWRLQRAASINGSGKGKSVGEQLHMLEKIGLSEID